MQLSNTGNANDSKTNLVESSENLYADLGIPNAEVHNIRVMLSISLAQHIEGLGLSQSEISRKYGIDQPKISKITRGKLDGFTIDRLISIAEKFGGVASVKLRFK